MYSVPSNSRILSALQLDFPSPKDHRLWSSVLNAFTPGKCTIPELDDRNKGLRRYRRNIRNRIFRELGPKVGPFFDVLYSLTADKETLLIIRDNLLRMEYNHWFDYLKSVGTAAKEKGTKFSPSWRDFVNIELSMGYYETRTSEDLLQRVRAWVDPRPAKPKDGFEFCSLFRHHCRRLFSSVICSKGNVAHFVKNRNLWATSGGSQDAGLLYKATNSVYSKTKWSYALSMTDSDIMAALFSSKPGSAVVSSVEGAGKDRIIISSDNDLHIKMSYINTIIERPLANMLSRLRVSSLYYNSSESVKLYLDEITKSSLTTMLKVPIDQSSFDQNQPKSHIMIILDELLNLLVDDTDRDIMRKIISSVSRTTIRVGQSVIPYSYGLLSGWRWTALLGTLCNIVSLMCILDMTKVEANFTCQGDDVSLHVGSLEQLSRVLDTYSDLGYDVNPSKFWISTYRNEFLRRVFSKHGTFGYPCRSLLSIFWKKPQGSFTPKSLREEMESTLLNWSTLMGRVGIFDDKRMQSEGLLEDLIGLSSGRIAVSAIKDWLVTARSLGGAGLSQQGSTAVTSKRTVRDEPFTNYRRDTMLDSTMINKYVRSRVVGRKAKFEIETSVEQLSDFGSVDTGVVSFLRSIELTPIDTILTRRFQSAGIFLDVEGNNLSDEAVFLLEEQIRRDFTLSKFDNVWRRLYKGPGSGVLDHIRKEGSVRLLQDFILGKISISSPVVVGFNPVVMAAIHNFVSNKFFLYLTSRRRIRYDWIRSSLLMCEATIRHLANVANTWLTFSA